jgi:hypothetical protein
MKKTFVQPKATFALAQFSPDATPAVAYLARGLSQLCDDLDAEFKQVHWELYRLIGVESKGGGV